MSKSHAYRAAKWWHYVYRDTKHQRRRLAPIPVADMLAMARAVLDAQAALDALGELASRERAKPRSEHLEDRTNYLDGRTSGLEAAYNMLKNALDGEGGGASA